MESQPITSVSLSELIPPGLQEPPPRRVIRRKRIGKTAGCDSHETVPHYREGIPRFFWVGVPLVLSLIFYCLRTVSLFSNPLIVGGSILFVLASAFFLLAFAGGFQENQNHRWLIRNGVVAIGKVTAVRQLIDQIESPSPTRHPFISYTFPVRESVIEGSAVGCSDCLDGLVLGSPVIVLYDPTNPQKRHALYQRLNYTVNLE